MSMTTVKETAFAYSGVRRRRGIVFEILAGRVDVGASIQFLSQYPGEAEFLTQPLCCLEVKGKCLKQKCTRYKFVEGWLLMICFKSDHKLNGEAALETSSLQLCRGHRPKSN